MNLLDKIPQPLIGRGHPDSVPVSCDCGNEMMWERRLGQIVTCTECKSTGAIVFPEKRNPPAAAVEAPTVALPQGPQIQLTRLYSRLTEEAKMQDVIALPDTLNDMLGALAKDAAAAKTRLAAARDKHTSVVAKIHKVAELVENSVAKSEHILSDMVGGNGPLAGSTT